MDFYIKQNDTGPQLQAQLVDATGTPVPLTDDCEVVFIMKVQGKLTNKVRSPAVILDTENSIVGYNWQAADTTEAKRYAGEFQVTFPSGMIITFPNNTYIQIEVYPELGS